MTTGLTNLERLERHAFRRFYDDGIVDIELGIMLVILGATTVFTGDSDDVAGTMLVITALAFAVTVPLLITRRRLLRSRLGTFRPGTERRRRIKRTSLVLLGSAILGVIAFGVFAAAAGGVSNDAIDFVFPLIWFVNGVLVFGAGAYFLNVPRFYFHGVMWGLAMPLLVWPDVLWGFEIPLWLAMVIPGGIIASVGIYKLATFLRDYPAPPTPGDLDG